MMTVQTLEEPPGVRVLHAVGDVDVRSTDLLLPGVADLVAGATALVLDLTEVTFFDSSGCRLVDRFARESRQCGVPFRVVCPPTGPCRRVLEIVGMADALVSDTLPDALTAMGLEHPT